ncbi:MAG: MFS transporter [Firmicutes bacterium]|nr:MFS transporter [Alicyclobacillaceae bacterium]MCL6498175.1 MFS transporter [Bacillota bacterium]
MAAIDVSQWFDSRPMRLAQLWVVILAGLLVTFDGIELVITGSVLPVIAKEWHISPLALGSVSSVLLFGIMVGAFISGPIADRIGRKWVVVASVFVYGVFSWITAGVANIHELLLLRFVVGVGVGGSLPNVIPLADEYSPRRLRKTMVAIAFMGITIGGVVVSLVAETVIPHLGWRAMFSDVAGIPALVLGLLAIVTLPESIRFLVAQGSRTAQIAAMLRRIDPQAPLSDADQFYLSEETPRGFPVRHLFDQGRARNTILLWLMFLFNFLAQYLVNTWLTIILTRAGFTLADAIWGLIAIEGSATIGGLLLGLGADRRNPKVILIAGFLLGAAGLVLLGMVHGFWPVMAMLFVYGLGIVGAQFGLNGLAASIYPVTARSTGVSWALGVGRFGGIAGPLLGAAFVSMKMPVTEVFVFAAIPAILAMVAMLFMDLTGAVSAAASAAAERA